MESVNISHTSFNIFPLIYDYESVIRDIRITVLLIYKNKIVVLKIYNIFIYFVKKFLNRNFFLTSLSTADNITYYRFSIYRKSINIDFLI